MSSDKQDKNSQNDTQEKIGGEKAWEALMDPRRTGEKNAAQMASDSFFSPEGAAERERLLQEGRIDDEKLRDFFLSYAAGIIDGNGLAGSFTSNIVSLIPDLLVGLLYDKVFIAQVQGMRQEALNKNDQGLIEYLDKTERGLEFDRKLSSAVLSAGIGLWSLKGGQPAGASVGFGQSFSNLNEILTSPKYADTLKEKAPWLIEIRAKNQQTHNQPGAYSKMYEHMQQFNKGEPIDFNTRDLREQPSDIRSQENGIDIVGAIIDVLMMDSLANDEAWTEGPMTANRENAEAYLKGYDNRQALFPDFKSAASDSLTRILNQFRARHSRNDQEMADNNHWAENMRIAETFIPKPQTEVANVTASATKAVDDIIMTAQSVFLTADTVSCQVAALDAENVIFAPDSYGHNIAVSVDNITVNTSADKVEDLTTEVVAAAGIQGALGNFITGTE